MFGAIGNGGAIVLIVVALILYKRGGGRIKPIKDHTVLYWSAALGLLLAGASESLRQVSDVATTFSQALDAQSATVGPIGAGAVALILLLVGFGSPPAMAKDVIVGVALPGAMSAAGGLLAIPVVVLASLVHGFGA
jgi:hypothetical protein